jgi:hypothetical protein
MNLLETRQCVERVLNSAQVTLTDGNHVQHITILGNLRKQLVTRGQSRGELIGLHQAPDADDRRLDARDRWRHGKRYHGDPAAGLDACFAARAARIAAPEACAGAGLACAAPRKACAAAREAKKGGQLPAFSSRQPSAMRLSAGSRSELVAKLDA